MARAGLSEAQRVEITRRALAERQNPMTAAGAVERVAAGYGVAPTILNRWVQQCDLYSRMDAFARNRRRRALYGGPLVIAFGLAGIPTAVPTFLRGGISPGV